MTPIKASADRESVFDRVADWVSAAMGRPANIMVWLVLVVGWTLLFAVHAVSANADFLPAWFTGTAFNFPLNLVTTVAELFIGFLVAAAANRSERNLELTLAAIAAQEKQIADVQIKLSEEVASNTALTQQVHDLASQIHDFLTAGRSDGSGRRSEKAPQPRSRPLRATSPRAGPRRVTPSTAARDARLSRPGMRATCRQGQGINQGPALARAQGSGRDGG